MKFQKDDIVKTLVKKKNFDGSFIPKNIKGVITNWFPDDSVYGVNFGKIYSIGYAEEELELVRRD